MKYKSLLSGLVLFLLQAGVFYFTFRYLFPFKEQLQLFQFTGQYLSSTLKQGGGVALYLSEFISQYFAVLGAGAVITAFLLTWVAVLSTFVLKRINGHLSLPFFYFLPWLSLFVMHLDSDYSEQGTIAYVFFLAFLWLYVRLQSRSRFALGLCLIPVLQIIAGPVAVLFAVSALLFEFLTNGNKKYLSTVYLLIAVLSAVVSTYLGYSRNLKVAFLPDAYYDPVLHNSQIYYAWYALPIAMLLVAYLNKLKALASWKGKCLSEVFQWAVILLLAYQGIVRWEKPEIQHYFEQDYYVRNGQWNKVISGYDHQVLSKRYISNLNLALAQKGILAECLFDYPQSGIETLMLRWDQTVFTAQLHSDLYYCMGIVSASQKFAFEALAASHTSGNPRMLKRLVETNMTTGAYPVAEKYIRILENTWQYKEWATSQRRFLNNDPAVEQDEVYGLKRRCWEAEKAIQEMYSNPVATLMHIVPACPENRAGLQYLTSFLLLNKDIETYRAFQEKVYRTPVWRDMSECQQEAIIICSPNDPRFWLEHGVSIKVRNKATAFMQKVQEASRFGQNPATVLASEYGKTYWYYYMFNLAGK